MNRDAILLLGGGGFIGTALSTRLAAEGRRVHVISRSPLEVTAPGISYHIGSLDDTSLLEKLQPACGTVVHLASVSTPGSTAGHPAKELDNLKPTLDLLEILENWPDTHLIFLSSGGTVYGNPAHNPVAEDALLAPLSYHGAGKLALEGFMNALRATGKPVTILRPSNAYGPGQGVKQGFGLIRTVLQHILQGSALDVWGDGKNVRDFIFIDDLVDAIIRTVNASTDSGTYNVGSGRGYTVNQVISLAEQVCGERLLVNNRPARTVDVRESVLNIALICAVHAWRPHVDLGKGIARTWDQLRSGS